MIPEGDLLDKLIALTRMCMQPSRFWTRPRAMAKHWTMTLLELGWSGVACLFHGGQTSSLAVSPDLVPLRIP